MSQDKAGGTMRIWYQSFIDPAEQRPYFERLQARLDMLKRAGTTVEIHGVTPPDRHFHALTEFRCADQCIRNALRAQEEGYDAFLIGHFQEPGLREIRGALDIPVIGLGEACMLWACSMGLKFGLVTINPAFLAWHDLQVAGHGLERRCVGVRGITADVGRFMAAFTDPAERDAMRADFVAQVQPLVAAGADVLIPAGGLPMLLLAELQPFLVDGAAVMEGLGVALKTAEMAIDMHRLTGVAAGRSGFYARASEAAIADFLAPRG